MFPSKLKIAKRKDKTGNSLNNEKQYHCSFAGEWQVLEQKEDLFSQMIPSGLHTKVIIIII